MYSQQWKCHIFSFLESFEKLKPDNTRSWWWWLLQDEDRQHDPLQRQEAPLEEDKAEAVSWAPQSMMTVAGALLFIDSKWNIDLLFLP